MPDKTIQSAAHELHLTVIALTELLEREYPKREEVEQNFISKNTGRKRWIVAVCFVLATTGLAFLGTIGTVSTCFLQGTNPTMCNVLPGYSDTQLRNRKIVSEFRHLQEVTENNDKRLTQLENAD
jgi:hypothetical protein